MEAPTRKQIIQENQRLKGMLTVVTQSLKKIQNAHKKAQNPEDLYDVLSAITESKEITQKAEQCLKS